MVLDTLAPAVVAVMVMVTVLVEQVEVDRVLFLVHGQILHLNRDRQELEEVGLLETLVILIMLLDMVEVVRTDWSSSFSIDLTPRLESVIISRYSTEHK